MTAYVNLDKADVAAFTFTLREKDYGGIHLALSRSSVPVLLELADELDMLPPGHSRRLPLLHRPDDIARHIVARISHLPLVSLRVGTAVTPVTTIQIANQAGRVELSPNALSALKDAITLVHENRGDLLIAGDSGSWTDRLWFWPLD